MEDKVIARPAIAQERRVLAARDVRLVAAPVAAIGEADPHASCRTREAALATQIRDEIALELASDAESQRQRAREEGFTQGWREGCDKAIEEARIAEEARVAGAEAIAEKILRAHEASLEATRDGALAIGFAAACRILGESLVTKAGVIAAIDQVLALAHANDRLTVRLAPADHALIDAQDARGPEQRVDYVADDSMERGGCVVESSAGTLDGRLRTQIEALYEALRVAQPGTGT